MVPLLRQILEAVNETTVSQMLTRHVPWRHPDLGTYFCMTTWVSTGVTLRLLIIVLVMVPTFSNFPCLHV